MGFAKKILLLVFAMAFFMTAVNAQAFCSNVWDKKFGGISFDEGAEVRQTTDGGYIIVGYTILSGVGSNALLVKTDSLGKMSWSETFGGIYNDFGKSVQQTADGGYIIAGSTDIIGTAFGPGNDEVWLIKTNSLGKKTWEKKFGGAFRDQAGSVQQTADGGYIITGMSCPTGSLTGPCDLWLIKTDSLGKETWNEKFGIGNASGNSVQQTADGGYIIGGQTFSFVTGKSDAWLIKTDSLGKETWSKIFDGSEIDYLSSVRQTADGGYIITGDGNLDARLIKTDSLGNETWHKPFGGSEIDRANSVQQTTDGGYIMAGETYSFGAGKSDVWLIKTDSLGNEIWNKTFGGTTYDLGSSVQQTTDGGYIITGYAESLCAQNRDVWLIKTDAFGNNPVDCYVCGNKIKECPEECDDADIDDVPADSIDDGACVIDTGKLECKNNKCGDGYLWSTASGGTEQCDDGNTVPGDGCDASCQIELPVCGNGVLEGTEQCDDSNTVDGDGCSSTCTLSSVGGGDVLELKITRTLNQASKQTNIFLQTDSVKLIVTVTNKLGLSVQNQPLEMKIFNISGELVYSFDPLIATFNPGANEFETEVFNWSGKPEGTYIFKASVPAQAGEESFLLNNSAEKFVNLGPPKPDLSVPETDFFLIPVIVLAVLALARFGAKKGG